MLGVDPNQLTAARVHLLWESCTVTEVLTMAATLAVTGDAAQAEALVQAVYDQCVGMGGVPQLGMANRPPVPGRVHG